MFTNTNAMSFWSSFLWWWSSMPLLWEGLFVLWIVCLWRVFAKAGQPEWAALIPIYNLVVLLKVCRRPIRWIVDLFFVPLLGVIAAIVVMVIFTQRAVSDQDPATAAIGGVLAFVLYVCGFVYGLVYGIRLLISLGRVFGKGAAFIIGLIIPFTSIIFWAILAFDGSDYRGEGSTSPKLAPVAGIPAVSRPLPSASPS